MLQEADYLEAIGGIYKGLFQRPYPLFICLWQVIQHLANGFADQGVTPVRRDVRQRHQNKGTILKPRVRQDQLVRRIDHLLFKRNLTPIGLGLYIRQHHFPHRDEIQIDRPRRAKGDVVAEQVEMAGTDWADNSEIEHLARHFEDRLDTAGFFYPEHKAASMKINLRNMWSRLPLTRADVQTLHGTLRQMVRWKERG